MKHTKKQFYLVFKGKDLDKPTLFSLWAKANKRVTGYSGNKHQAFACLGDAIEMILSRHIYEFQVDSEISLEDTRPLRGRTSYYAVASGEQTGVYLTYNGPEGAKKQVDGRSHNCHKAFRSELDAKQFVLKYDEGSEFKTIRIESDDTVDDVTRALQTLSIG